MRSLYVLIACECSQAETIAFRALGHRAYSCDIESVSKFGCPRWHIKGDVTPLLEGRTQFKVQSGEVERVPNWDLIICHPPCTYLTKIGSPHLYVEPDTKIETEDGDIWVNGERWRKLEQGRDFFLKCLAADAPFVAVENPIPMRLAKLPPPDTFACPSWFGSRFTKKTLYWLKNLPPLMPKIYYPDATSLVASRRGKYRSATDIHLANAIALQWGEYVSKELGINK